MSSLIARAMRSFDGDSQVYVYETVTSPPATDGAVGDYALCLGDGTLRFYGPKTTDAAWPPGALNTGPPGHDGRDGTSGSGEERPAPHAPNLFSLPEHVTSTEPDGVITPNQLSTMPFNTGAGFAVTGLGVRVGSTPQSGGAATCTLAIYGDDGTDRCTPNWSAGPLALATADLSRTGTAVADIMLRLEPSRTIHLAFLYVVTDQVGHVPPTLALVNGAAAIYAGSELGTSVRGFFARGVSAMPTAGDPAPALVPAPSSSRSVTDLPLVAIRNG